MRTAHRNEPHTHARQIAAALAAALLGVATTACDAPTQELAELQRDHERCLRSERNAGGAVRYSDYQACMSGRGWADPVHTHRG